MKPRSPSLQNATDERRQSCNGFRLLRAASSERLQAVGSRLNEGFSLKLSHRTFSWGEILFRFMQNIPI